MKSKNKKLSAAQKRKLARSKDLNYLIIRDKQGKAILRKSIYSRIVLNFFLIALQIAVFTLFLLEFQSKLEVYFGASLILSTGFMIYLSNCSGKNEYKIAWLLPTVIFPLFGVSAYILYHTNLGGRNLRKKLKILKEKTNSCLPPKEASLELLKKYPEIQGLATYLINSGSYYPHVNTSVTYFSSGEAFYPDMFQAIRNAKKFIFMEFFIIEVDETWALLVELLEQKVKEGLEVRVMFDGLGSPVASQKIYQKYLRERGIRVHSFLPLVPFFSTQQNNRDHRKIVIIDGEVAYTGGVNISNQYMNRGENRFSYWKDNAVRLEGPAIQNFMLMFLQTWNVGEKEKDDFVRLINFPYPEKEARGLVIPYGDDAFNQEDIAESVYLDLIAKADKYLYITSPYMVIDNQMQSALIYAVKRGVDVRVIVPSVPDHFLTFCIGKTYLKTLQENGIKVYTYQKGFIHSKTFICDDIIATVGSVNLDYRSLFYHFECGLLMYDTAAVLDARDDFEETLKDCQMMDKDSYKKIPSYQRAIGRVFRIFASLI
ncbi:MAG: cardiolipin synthase [Treponema sp.]|nr:cardiolipin synthase [Treponema sp.]